MNKVVVTGGAGFIGSHLVDALVECSQRIIILDDLSSGKKENIKQSLGQNKVEFVEGMITDLPLLQRLFRNAEFVFHLAAVPSVPRSVDTPLLSHEVNATGTLKVLIASRDAGVNKVVYSSSSAVYGDTPTLPKKEDMPPHPQSPYAVAKLTGEYYCQVFHRVYDLPTICLRYFNVYGPRQDPNSQYAAVIPRFLQLITNGMPPVIFGDGEQTRDFTFVKDVVATNILVAKSSVCGVYNTGTGERTSLNQLAEIITRVTDNSIKPIYEKSRAGDILHSLADISKAESFGYKPQYNLLEGIKQTIEQIQ